MNAVYRVVWNAASGQWVVASELAKGRKKKSMSRAIVAALTVAVVGVGAGAASRVQAMDAIGNGAVQGNAANTVIGDSAQGNAACGTLLMPGTACSTVVGNSAKSTGFASVAMGDHAESGQLSTAIGSYAKSGTYSQAIGADAQATGGWATAIGQGARATFRDTTAIGTNARSLAERATAIGSGANANSNDSFAIGWSSNATGAGSMAFGTSVTVAGVNAIALGLGSTATADNTVALGANSVANRVNTISVGAAGTERQIVNVAAGVEDTDAVNVSQLKPVIGAIGGGAAIDPITGVVTGPTYNVGGNTYNNVGDALTNVDGRTTVNEGDITNLKSGTVGLVTQADANAVVNVATASGGTSVNFAGTAGDRQLRGVGAGVVDNDAVNIGQLKPVIDGIGGGATIDPVTGVVTGPTYNIGGNTYNNVGDALTNVDGRTTINEGDILNLKNGTSGLVTQKELTGIGSSTDKWIDVPISLDNCPAFFGAFRGAITDNNGVAERSTPNQISYRVDPVTSVVNPAQGVMALQPDGVNPTAQGIGIQLVDAGDNPVSYGNMRASGLALNQVDGSSYTISLKARYYQTEATTAAGQANGAATVTLIYN
jgi:autotransporter adhesin